MGTGASVSCFACCRRDLRLSGFLGYAEVFGTSLCHYRILGKLGGGGRLQSGGLTAGALRRSEVHAARACLRASSSEMLPPRSEGCFRSHPNICRVYDIGEQDGQVFIAWSFSMASP